MDTQVIVGGLAACLGLGYLLYRYSDDGVSETATLTRDNVVRILEELRDEFMNIEIQISQFAMSIKEQMGGRIPDEYIKEIIMNQTPIGEQIAKSEAKIYQKNSISKEMFEHACTKTYAGDNEIKNLMDEMKTSLDNSFAGITPTSNRELPDFMTPDLAFEIFKDMNNATLLAMYDIIEDIKSKGIRENSPQFQMEFEKQGHKIEGSTYKVFKKYGIADLDEPATLLVQRAMQFYENNDMNFRSKKFEYEKGMRAVMQAVMMGRVDPYELETIRARLNAEPKVEEIKEEALIEPSDTPIEKEEEEFNDNNEIVIA